MSWIDVNVSLPEMSMVVWVKHKMGRISALAWRDHNGGWYSINSIGDVEEFADVYNYDFGEDNITHWQQLPEPPEL